MRVTAQEFFQQFLLSFRRRLEVDPQALLQRFRDPTSWSNVMLRDIPGALLPGVVESLGQGRLEARREFKFLDLCAWQISDDPYHKPQYDQPLNVNVVVEHENNEQSEEEFWKLLHFHAPLKILVCYPTRPDAKIAYFQDICARVWGFHAPPPNEEYLVIVGPRREKITSPAQFQWHGWATVAPDAKFTQLPVA